MRVLLDSASRRRTAFSLIETALAVAILGVVVIGLIGLIPSGTATFQKAMDTSVSAQIAQRIVTDAEQSEFDVVIDKASLPSDPESTSYCPKHFTFRAPKVKIPGWRYYDAQGSEIRVTNGQEPTEQQKRAIVYHVNTRVMPRAVLPTMNESSSQVALITVQVVRNPGNIPLEFAQGSPDDPETPERNLVKPGRAPIYTYTALIGRNHGR